VRLAVFPSAQDVETPERHGSCRAGPDERNVVIVESLDGPVEHALSMAELARGVAPQLESRKVRPSERRAVLVEADHANVVAEHLVALAREMRSKGRFAGSGMARKRERPSVCHDGVA
jgi:hypothetical protein